MHPCIRASSPSLARAHELVASQHSPCSTFELRHPCLGYANLQQRQRRLQRGNWCNSAKITLLEITYITTEIRPFSRHRRNCDLPSQGWRGRAYRDVLATTSLFNGQLTIPGSRSKACCYATLAMSQAHLCEKRTAGDWPLLNHVICANGCRRHRGGIGAILLVPSSLKH